MPAQGELRGPKVDGEAQYAGDIRAGDPRTAREERVHRANRLPAAGRDRELARLRAEQAAAAEVGNRERLFLMIASCAACGEPVGRDLVDDADVAVLTAWAHMVRRLDGDHPVLVVTVP